jgi:aminoglycoside 6'-N-acetyltransferase
VAGGVRVNRVAPAVLVFRRVGRHDFPLLAQWLAHPHVARWWCHDFSPEGVERDFGASADGTEPSEDWFALLHGRPVGLVQRCRVADYPEYAAEFAQHIEVPPGAVTLDYLVGEPDDTGRGLGTAMVRAMVERTWADYPDTPAIVVAVVAANRPSWRALEKAGFRRIASGDLTPDNPVDDPLHYIYRIDRPARVAGGSD